MTIREFAKLNNFPMENELAAVQQAISNLMKAIEAGIITPTTRTRLLDLEEQQSKLSAKINTAKAERVEINRDDLIAGLQLFRTGDNYVPCFLP